MSGNDELEASIKEYETQLIQVKEGLKYATKNTEKESLQSLKNDLEELISLTSQQFVNQSQDAIASSSTSHTSYTHFDDEMFLLMNEIQSLESTSTTAGSAPPPITSASTSQAEDCDETKLQAIKDELQAMVGRKCSAPHDHLWGSRVYHNAIVCGVENSDDCDFTDINEHKVLILFTNPTHQEMIPCSYYLDGDCKFDAEKCRFSHGEAIPLGQLKEYKEPNFTLLKRNCHVLAKMSDKMWHKAKVICANFEEKTCRVRLEHKKKEADFDFEDLLPIFEEDESSDSESYLSDSDGDDSNEMQRAFLIEKSLLTPAADQKLGEWEKFTKGIGSKLMQKMGYIIGNGLGSQGDGIIVPVSAQLFPKGRSLDHCMALRDAAKGDKNLFSVEKQLKRQQKRQEAVNQKAYEREKNKTDIFSFLNDRILTSAPNSKNSLETESKSTIPAVNDFKNHSVKNLNVESLKIADNIRKTEREIVKLKDSIRRHSPESELYKRLQSQIDKRNHELKELEKLENTLSREQISRKHKAKMSVF